MKYIAVFFMVSLLLASSCQEEEQCSRIRVYNQIDKDVMLISYTQRKYDEVILANHFIHIGGQSGGYIGDCEYRPNKYENTDSVQFYVDSVYVKTFTVKSPGRNICNREYWICEELGPDFFEYSFTFYPEDVKN